MNTTASLPLGIHHRGAEQRSVRPSDSTELVEVSRRGPQEFRSCRSSEGGNLKTGVGVRLLVSSRTPNFKPAAAEPCPANGEPKFRNSNRRFRGFHRF